MGVGAGLYMFNVVAKKFTFAISSPDEFLCKRSPKISPKPCSFDGLTVLDHGGATINKCVDCMSQ